MEFAGEEPVVVVAVCMVSIEMSERVKRTHPLDDFLSIALDSFTSRM